MSRRTELRFLTCDDWAIIAVDSRGRAYYVVTEIWPEWLDFPEEAQYETNSVCKYMLPVAFKKWDRLPWSPVVDEHGNHVRMGIKEWVE